MSQEKAQTKPKMYTQAQVDKLVAQARKDAKNPIPSPAKQAKMKKKLAEEKMDAKMSRSEENVSTKAKPKAKKSGPNPKNKARLKGQSRGKRKFDVWPLLTPVRG